MDVPSPKNIKERTPTLSIQIFVHLPSSHFYQEWNDRATIHVISNNTHSNKVKYLSMQWNTSNEENYNSALFQ